jgi:DNA-binding CsgD family transcriptional regulator
MRFERELPELLEYVYGAAADRARWGVFLEQLCGRLRGARALLLEHNCRRPEQRLMAVANIEPDAQNAYLTHYFRVNPWLRFAGPPVPGRALPGDAVLPASELLRTEFYQDFLRPQDILHTVGACIGVDGERAPFCAVFRSGSAGVFEDAEAELLAALSRHIRRALELQERSEVYRAQSAAALTALDALPAGCLLIDAACAVQMANRAAEEILNERDGLAITAGALCATSAEAQERLRRLAGGMRGALAVTRRSGRPPLHLLVIPFRGSSKGAERAASALVFITDPEASFRPSQDVLGAILGFPPAESRVASALLNGRSIDQCAAELAISRHTARNHLKAIFSKTSTTRQGELLRLLLTSVTRLRVEG